MINGEAIFRIEDKIAKYQEKASEGPLRKKDKN